MGELTRLCLGIVVILIILVVLIGMVFSNRRGTND